MNSDHRDLVIHKSRGSAIYNTYLDNILKIKGVIVLTGCLTSGCVLNTAVDAMHYGYYPVVVRDCVGDYDTRS
jgi:maleamate amidohydrolase